ncbi:ATP-binding protein [Sphingomonas tabacisoli]|uniref:ATP-binding protein n=1 Tax=Sphingomonas tabacisoli TaxID=2249466 RepID=A0ABW4I3R5_9SPHN
MAARDSAPVTLRFAPPLVLREVLALTIEACRQLPLQPFDEGRLAIVVEELLANLFEHGGLGANGRLELSLELRPDSVHVMIYDSARAFDPADAPEHGKMPERGGGAGLAIVRRWANILSYEPGPPLNRLILALPLSSGPLT